MPLADVGTPLLGRMRSSGPPDHAQEHVGVGCAHPWDERVPSPGRDATLLAVVPIPGTGTSLAVVGYVIATSAGPQPEPPRPAGEPRRTRGAGLRLDRAQRRVWAEGREIQLTFQEFELLAFLSAHPATVFSRADLIEHVWHREAARDSGEAARDSRAVARDSRTVDVHVSRVRHKLGPRFGQCLVTEYRVGYQFRPITP